MRFFERAAPKPTDPYEALLQHLDQQAEEVEEKRLAEMQYGRTSHQGRRYRDDPMDQEEAINVALVIALLTAVVVLLLLTLQQTA